MTDKRKRGRPKKDLDAREMLTSKQLRAIGAEIENHPLLIPEKFTTSALIETSDPFHKPAQRVANAVGVSKRSVEKWRKESAPYIKEAKLNLRKELNEQISGLITIKLVDRDAALKKEKQAPETGAIERGRWIKRNWKGPVKCPIDGQTFKDPDAYFLHMEKHGVVPWDLIEDKKAKK